MPDAWRCPTCGSDRVPDDWRPVQGAWEKLTANEKAVAGELLATLRLHGNPSDRSWTNALWDCLRVLLPGIDAENIEARDAHYFLPGLDEEVLPDV